MSDAFVTTSSRYPGIPFTEEGYSTRGRYFLLAFGALIWAAVIWTAASHPRFVSVSNPGGLYASVLGGIMGGLFVFYGVYAFPPNASVVLVDGHGVRLEFTRHRPATIAWSARRGRLVIDARVAVTEESFRLTYARFRTTHISKEAFEGIKATARAHSWIVTESRLGPGSVRTEMVGPP